MEDDVLGEVGSRLMSWAVLRIKFRDQFSTITTKTTHMMQTSEVKTVIYLFSMLVIRRWI